MAECSGLLRFASWPTLLTKSLNEVTGSSPYQRTPMPACANYTYYIEIGLGQWIGSFHFKVVDWTQFWWDRIGLKDRLLVILMALAMKLLGWAKITSCLKRCPDEQGLRVVANDVRITKFGVTLYLLKEKYVLSSDCHSVWVRSKERFGPVPFLFNVAKEHPAEILDDGMNAVYYIPLLGAKWIARYKVRTDHYHIDSEMHCSWGEAKEVIDRVV